MFELKYPFWLFLQGMILGILFLWRFENNVFCPKCCTPYESKEAVDSLRISTSVWCRYSIDGSAHCSFQNLCFNNQTGFIFFLTENSSMIGLKTKENLMKIRTSSVYGFNGMSLNLTIISQKEAETKSFYLKNFNYVLLDNPIFIMSRFKPDNIMHVIHDDLLPLFNIFNEICAGSISQCSESHLLLFTDSNPMAPYVDWYNKFSLNHPLHLTYFSNGETYCFQKTKVGLSRETLFYQYGFQTPHGALEDSNVSSSQIQSFSNFLLEQFDIEHSTSSSEIFKVTLILRERNRKILNEEFILENIKSIHARKSQLELRIERVGMLLNSTVEILKAVSTSNVLLGVHGAAMMLAVFLPPGATAIELFPLGIVPENVSPLLALAKVEGIHFRYLSWENINSSNSVPQPNNPPLLGGISHLPMKDQEKIEKTKSVPPVKCCHDPSYLYRIFQDTVVDESFLPVLKEAFTDRRHLSYGEFDGIKYKWFFPGKVVNGSCYFTEKFTHVYWRPPVNVEGTGELRFLVTVSGSCGNYTLATKRNEASFRFRREISRFDVIHSWVSSEHKDFGRSLDTYLECIPDF